MFMKRFLCILISLFIFTGVFSIKTFAEEETQDDQQTVEIVEKSEEEYPEASDSTDYESNQEQDVEIPVLSDEEIEESFNYETTSPVCENDGVIEYNINSDGDEQIIYENQYDAGPALRQAIVNREDSLTIFVKFYADEGEDLYSLAATLAAKIINEVSTHTGNPVEGDYLNKGREWFSSHYVEYYQDGDHYVAKITYTLDYYFTDEQEEELATAIDELISSLDLEGKSDFEKAWALYDYVTSTVQYDDDHQYLCHTAYAAMINKSAVCEGIAILMYRLLLTVGIDCRYIAGGYPGPMHGWNIVKIGDYYYNIDATWDLGGGTKYFLLSSYSFDLTHERNNYYKSDSFMEQYPMAEQDYGDDSILCYDGDTYEISLSKGRQKL